MNSFKSPAEFFEDSLSAEILNAQKRVKKLKMLNYAFQISIIILSAISTVVLGLNYANDDKTSLIIAKNLALILGALVTLLSSIKAFWNLDTYWMRGKLYYYQLQEISDEFAFYRSSNTGSSIEDLFRKLQAVKKFHSSYWEDVYQQTHMQQTTNKQDVNIKEKQ